MSSSSERAAEYRRMVEDVLAGGLLEPDEMLELRDMLARAERKVRTRMADDHAHEPAQ